MYMSRKCENSVVLENKLRNTLENVIQRKRDGKEERMLKKMKYFLFKFDE